jgi:hypothetical protein
VPRLKFAALPDDEELLELGRAWAERLLADDPELEAAEHAPLAAALEDRFAGPSGPDGGVVEAP